VPRSDWSRPLPRPVIVPDLLTLETLAHVRTLVDKHLPAEYRAKFSWRHRPIARTSRRDAKCQLYGAKPGEPAYVQCRAQLNAARTGAIATAASGGAAAPAAPIQYPPIVYPAAPHPGRF
jgi:hypothetical protein